MTVRTFGCPVCGRAIQCRPLASIGQFRVTCHTCGDFQIDEDVIDDQLIKKSQRGYILSGVIRRASSEGRVLTIDSHNLSEYVSEMHLPLGLLAQLDLILLHIADTTERAGQYALLPPETTYPVAFARDPEEFSYMLELLRDSLGFLENPGDGRFRPTAAGWRRLEELRPRTPGLGKRCFVAMSFADELNEVWEEGLRPGIADAGYEPNRMDRIEHNEKICDKIIADIRQSRLVVADFTHHRGGVYFEAGFALGLGLPVIWTCRSDHLTGAHFDTRQYNHITWETANDLKQKLTARIKATCPI